MASPTVTIKELLDGLNSKCTNIINNSVTNATSVKTDSTEIIALIRQMNTKFDEELEEIKKLAKATTDFHASFKAGSGGSGSSGGAGGAGGSKSTASVKDLSSGGGSLIIPTDKRIWVGIAAFSKTAQKQISNAIQMSGCCAALSKSMSKSRKSSVKVDSVFSLSEKSGTSSARAAGKAARRSSATGKSVDLDAVDASSKKGVGLKMGGLLALEMFKTFTGNLVEAYDFNYMKIFDNQFANSRNYIESSNMLIHEQIGYGASDLKIAASYRDITDTIRISGYEAAKVKEMQNRNAERGFKIEKEEDKLATKNLKIDRQSLAIQERKFNSAKRVQLAAMSTAYGLHMSADATNDLFMEWSMKLGMSDLQMASIGRHMNHIAKTTGLTGSELEKAMKSSDGLVKNLYKAGSIDLDAIKTITQFTAASQKYGFEGAEEIVTALSSGKGFLEADPKLRSYLLTIADAAGGNRAEKSMRMTKIMSGSALQDPKTMKALAAGNSEIIKKEFRKITPELARIGVDANTIDPTDFVKVLDKMKKSEDPQLIYLADSINNTFQNRFGKGAGELESAQKAMVEAGKTQSDRLAEVTTKLNNLKAAGMTGSDEYKRNIKLKSEIEQSRNADIFSKIAQNQGKFDQNLMNQIKGDFGSDKEAQDFLKNINKEAKNYVTDIGKRAKDAGVKDVNATLVAKGFKGGLGEVEKLLVSGDDRGQKALDEVLQEINRREREQQDPGALIKAEIKDLSNNIAALTESLDKLLVWLGKWSARLTPILTAISVGLLVFGKKGLQDQIGYLFDWGKKIMGYGGDKGKAGTTKTPSPKPSTPFGRSAAGAGTIPGRSGSARVPRTGPPPLPPSTTFGRVVPKSSTIPRKGSATPPPLPRSSPPLLPKKGLRLPRSSTATPRPPRPPRGSGGVSSFVSSSSKIPKGKGLLGKGLGLLGRGKEMYDTFSDKTGMDLGNVAGMFGGGGEEGAEAGGLASLFSGGCIPVCIVGGLDKLSESLAESGEGSGWGISDIMTLVADAPGYLDDIKNFKSMFKKVDKVDDVLKATTKVVDKVDDVAKLAGLGAKASKVTDVAGLGAKASKVTDVAGKASKVTGVAGKAGKLAGAADDVAKLTGFGAKASKVTGVAGKAGKLATGVEAVGGAAVAGAAGKAGDASKALGTGSKLLGKAMAFLPVAIGGITGAMEAEETGRSTLGAGILGALTGDATTGSSYSGYLGIDKGSSADELMGVAGATLHGGTTGAAIGTAVFPGVGTAIGGAVGSVVGFGAEVVKIFTAEKSALRTAIVDKVDAVWDGTKNVAKSIWGGIGGVASSLWSGAKSLVGISDKSAELMENSKANTLLDNKKPVDALNIGAASGQSEGFLSNMKDSVKGLAVGAFDSVNKMTGGALDSVKNVASSAYDSVSGLASSAYDSVNNMTGGALDSVKNVAMGALQSAKSAVVGAYDSVKGALGGVYDSVTGALGGTYDSVKGALGVAYDSVKGAVGGVYESVKGVLGGAYESVKGAVGGVYNSVAGALDGAYDSVKGALGGAYDSVKGAIGGVYDSVKGALGVAYNSVKGAVGGVYDSVAGAVGGVYDSVTGAIGGAFANPKDEKIMAVKDDVVADKLNNIISSSEFKNKQIASPLSLGAFEGGQANEANDDSSNKDLKKMSYLADSMKDVFGYGKNELQSVVEKGVNSRKSSISYSGLGLFDPERPEQAEDGHIDQYMKTFGVANFPNALSSIFENEKNNKYKTLKNEINTNPLDYVDQMKGELLKNSSIQIDQMKGEIATNPIDYTDQIKGEVGTLGLSRSIMESAVSQEKYGTSPNGNTAILPSMDSIAEYLVTTQSHKLDNMIDLLTSIKENLAMNPSISKKVGPIGGGSPIPTRPGVKNIARDTARGFWDFTYGSYSPNSLTTDGRGGSQ